MNQAQGAAATGESEGTTSLAETGSAAPQKGAEGAQTQEATQGQPITEPTRLGALLAGMELPPDVLAAVTPKEEEGAAEHEHEQEHEQEQEQEQEQPGQEPAQEEEQPAPVAAEQEEHVPEEWPASAKARVAQEAEKRRKWKATAEQLQAQVQEAQGKAPVTTVVTPQDPLADILDLQTLAQKQRDWQEIMDFVEDNPDGAYDVVTGKDAQGNDVRRDYSADQIKEIKHEIRPKLRAVPARAQYLVDLQKNVVEAHKAYPEMFQEGSQLNLEANQLLNLFPEARRVPDYLIAIGDMLAGQKMRLAKNGQTAAKPGMSAAAQAILAAPKVTPAPGVIKSRSPESGASRQTRSDVDQKQAREAFAQRNYSPDALDDFVAALRRGQQAGKGPKQRTLV
jgi:hypothetical protein